MTDDRTPPHNLDAERATLGGMLLSKHAIPDVTDLLVPEDFYQPAHELIYTAILDLYACGDPVDAVTVSAELGRRGEIGRVGGVPYLHQLMGCVPTGANATYYAVIVREHATRRRIIDAGTRIAQMGWETDDGSDLPAIVDRVQAEAFGLADTGMANEDPANIEVFDGMLGEIEHGVEHGMPTGFSDLDQLTRGLHPDQLIIIAARPAIGKALALDTPLPTPTGWTTMGAVRVGDQLIGADGRPTTVAATTDVMHGRPCYEVEFSDGTVIVADADHQWLTETRRVRRGTPGAVPAVVTTKEIAATLRCVTSDQRPNHSVTVARAAQLPDADLPLGPYTLGAWLGDGSTRGARITTPDPEVIAEIEKEGYRTCAQSGLNHGIYLPPRAPLAVRKCVVCESEFQPQTSQVRTCGRSCGGRSRGISTPVAQPTCPDCGRPFTGLSGLCQECRHDHGTVQAILRKIGVLGDKHIPAPYLRASESQRRALLAGLLDSDGYCSKSGTVQFAVTRERLARDAFELVLSLGYKATLTSKPATLYGKDCGTAWTVTFTPSDRVFRLPRKGDRQLSAVSAKSQRRYITDVRQVESVPVRCVQVDNEDHLYLASRSWIPTHNSTLALDLVRSISIKHRHASAFFSLEMNRGELIRRATSAEGRINLHHLAPNLMTDDDWARAARVREQIVTAPIVIDDAPDLTVMRIRTKSRRLKARHDLRLIVVDYVQLMSSGAARKFENRQSEVSAISRGLKLLAKELHVPVVMVAQLNRGPEQRSDKRPMLSDLRESGSLEQDADVVILLHREDAYDRESPRAGEADLIIAKHRNGPTATITVAFQGHYSRFVDMKQS